MELASGYLVAGEVDRAIELIESLPESDTPGGYQREYLLMLALVGKGQNEAALDRARELSRTRGYDPTIRNLVAGLYAALGKGDEARAELQAALQTDPNHVATYLNLARLDASQTSPMPPRRTSRRRSRRIRRTSPPCSGSAESRRRGRRQGNAALARQGERRASRVRNGQARARAVLPAHR
jgi:tetratricopeptide (TPR) repeat protein